MIGFRLRLLFERKRLYCVHTSRIVSKTIRTRILVGRFTGRSEVRELRTGCALDSARLARMGKEMPVYWVVSARGVPGGISLLSPKCESTLPIMFGAMVIPLSRKRV